MGKTQKYIFVTGGVLSGVGKGITAASIGALLQAKGAKVSIQKCDPYLNVDAGLLDPREHGESFVTKDGAETDLDLGHYERFLDIELTRKNTTLSGRLLLDLITAERAGKYNGKTVQLVPHLTRAIQEKISQASEGSDVHIVEIGGTVGDYESLSFIEAIREFSWKVGRQNCLFVHLVYVPFITTSKEFKTKPAQNALNDLRGFGIVPDAVVVRTEEKAPQKVAHKISLFGGVPEDQVLLMPNVDSVYRIPLTIADSKLNGLLAKFTGLSHESDLSSWQNLLKLQAKQPKKQVNIGIVSEYSGDDDVYLSVEEALRSSGWTTGIGVKISWLDTASFKPADLDSVDAVIVPGGFGDDGFEAKIAAASACLQTDKPYLGIGMGMQVAAIAALRLAGNKSATSAEVDPSASDQVVSRLPDGSRRGNYKIKLEPGSKVQRLYGDDSATERHRHNYYIDIDRKPELEAAGLEVSAVSSDGKVMEFIESSDKKFFVTTQANIEFRSRPTTPNPIFIDLLRSVAE